MTIRRGRSPAPKAPGHDSPSGHSGARADILMVGLDDAEVRTMPTRLFGALARSTSDVDYHGLEPDEMRQAMAVLSPVVARDFDVVELAERLQLAGFRGRYVAYSPERVHESMIRTEVAAVAPDLAFDIITLGHGPRLATQ